MIFVTKLLENHQPNRPPQSIRSQSVLHKGSDSLEIGEEGTRLSFKSSSLLIGWHLI